MKYIYIKYNIKMYRAQSQIFYRTKNKIIKFRRFGLEQMLNKKFGNLNLNKYNLKRINYDNIYTTQ